MVDRRDIEANGVLKRFGRSADPLLMFFPRSQPLVVAEEALRSLRLSLNEPEVATEDLPAGPARAGIVLHGDAETLRVVVLVQSMSSGKRVCWAWDGVLDTGSAPGAIDAALSFAEGMGFLFDEDALASAQADVRRRALDHWWELVGWPDRSAETPPIATAEAMPGPPMLPSSTPSPSEPGASGPRRDGLPLTKFRRRLGGQSAEVVSAAPRPTLSALGRLRLIKRIRQGEAGERSPRWLRLLGSF